MNARSRFSLSAIPNGHTASGLAKKTVVRGGEKEEREEKKKKSVSSI